MVSKDKVGKICVYSAAYHNLQILATMATWLCATVALGNFHGAEFLDTMLQLSRTKDKWKSTKRMKGKRSGLGPKTDVKCSPGCRVFNCWATQK